MNTDAIGGCLGAIFLIILILAILAFPTLWLWNWLMPVIFGLPTITFWQALGLNVLSSILFKTHTTNNN